MGRPNAAWAFAGHEPDRGHLRRRRGRAVGGGDDVPFVLRTRDAGRTWSEQSLPDDVPGLLATVAAASATDVIAVGFEPHGVATASGGATWESGVFPDEFMRLWDVAIATD